MNVPQRQTGFSLIELSVVLIIIGILFSLTIPALTPQIKRAAEKKARTLLEANIDSLVGYAAGNQRLPTTTTFKNALRAVTDGFSDSSEFRYLVDSRLKENNSICDYTSTYLSVVDCGSRDAAACDTTSNYDTLVTDVAFVLVSAGSDGNNQTATNTEVAAATTIKIYNYDNVGEDGYTTDTTAAASDPYDDYVGWATLAEVKAGAGCSGPPITITNTNLPDRSLAAAYSAGVFATGGKELSSGGAYKWCIKEITGWSSAELTLPGGMTTGTTDCPSDETDARWTQADYLVLTGAVSATTTSAAVQFEVYVRDNSDGDATSASNADNISSKRFGLNVTP